MFRTAWIAVYLLAAAPLAGQVTPAPSDTTLRAGRADSILRADSAALGIRRDSVVTPVSDDARGVDAEIRAALYELLGDRPVPALSRLQWLSSAPVALTATAAPGALRGRGDLLFLLAETYYRLGMDSAFRATAQSLASSSTGSRYVPVLKTQLLLEAYRRGDYAGAVALAADVDVARSQGLGPLVAGLAHFQMRAYPAARTAFAAAVQAGGPYAPYGRYMDALAMLRGDTAQTGQALAALQSLATAATGEFADQVRLTAAQLAYEAERYPDAVQLAGGIAQTSGLAAQGLLTRAWALYKANDIAAAGQAFAEFAQRYPDLPERDESRLMSGQALLELGQTEPAAQIFRTVADSNRTEVQTLQTRTRAAMSDAARALVQARAAGLLFISDPETGKTIALEDAAGADWSVLAQAFADSSRALSAPAVTSAEIIAIDDVRARFDSLGPTLNNTLPRRLLFTPASATTNPARYALSAQALYSADVGVALARYRLDELLRSHQRQIALLRQLSQQLAQQADTLARVATVLNAAQDSLARLASSLETAAARLRLLFQSQINVVRLLANENAALLDSVARTFPTTEPSAEGAALQAERETAAAYRRIADLIESGLDNAISRHPTFAMRDSVRKHGEKVGALLADAQNALASAQQVVASELTRLESGDPDAVRAQRATLASAEARRGTVEGQVIAVVDAELNARASEMLAVLRRDTEAADFGEASTTFFRSLDQGGRPGTTGPTGASGSSGTGASAAAPDAPAPGQIRTSSTQPRQ
jgi:hypothetical protein